MTSASSGSQSELLPPLLGVNGQGAVAASDRAPHSRGDPLWNVEIVDACPARRGRRRHVAYRIELWASGCYMWTVERRYRSFLALHRAYGGCAGVPHAPHFPGSTRTLSVARICQNLALGRFDAELIEGRRNELQVYLSKMICAQAGSGVLPACLWDFLGWDQGLPAPEYCPVPRTTSKRLVLAPTKGSDNISANGSSFFPTRSANGSGGYLGVDTSAGSDVLDTSVGMDISWKTAGTSTSGNGASTISVTMDVPLDPLRARQGVRDGGANSWWSASGRLPFWPEDNAHEGLVCLESTASSV